MECTRRHAHTHTHSFCFYLFFFSALSEPSRIHSVHNYTPVLIYPWEYMKTWGWERSGKLPCGSREIMGSEKSWNSWVVISQKQVMVRLESGLKWRLKQKLLHDNKTEREILPLDSSRLCAACKSRAAPCKDDLSAWFLPTNHWFSAVGTTMNHYVKWFIPLHFSHTYFSSHFSLFKL